MQGTLHVLRRVVRNTWWDAYDHLGQLVLVNVIWFLGSLPIVTLPLTTAGLLCFTYEIAVSREAQLSDLLRGVKRLWLPAVALAVGALALLGMAVGNVLFYLELAQDYPMIGLALAGVCFWVTLGLMLGLQFVVPAAVELWLAEDEVHKERVAWMPEPPVVHGRRLGLGDVPRGVKPALKVGFVVLLHAPAVAMLHLIGLAVFWAVCCSIAVAFVLFGAGVTCLACHHLYAETVAELTGLGDRREQEYRRPKDTREPHRR